VWNFFCHVITFVSSNSCSPFINLKECPCVHGLTPHTLQQIHTVSYRLSMRFSVTLFLDWSVPVDKKKKKSSKTCIQLGTSVCTIVIVQAWASSTLVVVELVDDDLCPHHNSGTCCTTYRTAGALQDIIPIVKIWHTQYNVQNSSMTWAASEECVKATGAHLWIKLS